MPLHCRQFKIYLIFTLMLLVSPAFVSSANAETRQIKFSNSQPNQVNKKEINTEREITPKSNSIVASTPEEIANSLPYYMLALFNGQTDRPVYWKDLGLTYNNAMTFEPLRIENLEQDSEKHVILSVVPKIEVKIYLDTDIFGGNLDLYVYEGETTTGELLASSTNTKDYDEFVTFVPSKPMNITINVVHNPVNSTNEYGSGTLYVGQYLKVADIYRLYVEGRHETTGQPRLRTNYYFPHLKYYDLEYYGSDGIYLQTSDNLQIYQMRVYDDYLQYAGTFYGTDNNLDYVAEGTDYGEDLCIATIDHSVGDGFRLEIEGGYGEGFVTLGVSGYAYGEDIGFQQWLYPRHTKFNATRPIIPVLIVNPTPNKHDFEPIGVFCADNDTKAADLNSLDGTIDAVIYGIYSYRFQPASDLKPGDYYINVKIREGGVYSSRFYYFTVISGNDETAPTFNHIFPDMRPDLDKTLLIYANVTDEVSPIKSVKLYYRKGTTGEFTAVSMQNMFDGIYCAPLPLDAKNFQIGDIVQYYLSASDEYNNTTIENNNGTYYSFIVSDVSGPAISDVAYTPDPAIEGEEITIKCRVADPSGVENVIIHYGTSTTSFFAKNMSLEIDINYTATIGPFNKGERAYFFITATDNSPSKNEAFGDNKGLYYSFVVLDKDLSPPLITDIAHSPASPTEGDNITISCKVSDDSGVAYVTLYYRINRGKWFAINMTANGELYNCTIGPFSLGDKIEYYVVAVDNSLNRNEAIANNEGNYYSFVIEEAKKSPIPLGFIISGALVIGLIKRLKRKRLL